MLDEPTLEADNSLLESPTEPGGIREQALGPYRLVGYLGRGGMAIVYSARDRSDAPVAVKVLEETPLLPVRLIKRFVREAEATKKLRTHPNVVTVYDTGKEGATHYIAMELVPDGRSLTHLLAEAVGPLPIDDVLRIGTAIASALSYAHTEGIIHRDVKPSNILVNAFGTPLLADFGLARWQDGDSHSLTLTSAAMGTPKYMSPEQIQSGRNANEASDQYSFGCVLYELATGHIPYHIDAEMGLGDILNTIRTVPPRDPRKLNREISRDLAAVLLKSLEKVPEDRYPDMTAMLADLQACAAHQRVSVRIPTIFERCDRLIFRHKMTTLVIIAAITTIVIGIHHYREKLLAEQRKQWVPQARAHSNQSELDRLRNAKPADDEADTKQDHLLVLARNALRIENNADSAERILRKALPEDFVAEGTGLGSEHVVLLREMARIKLAKGETELAEKLFMRIMKSDTDASSQDSETTPEGLYARFEASLACLARNDEDAAKAYWGELSEKAPGNTPLAAVSRAGLGELPIEELLAQTEHYSDANAAIAFWVASKRIQDPERAWNLKERAKNFAEKGLPWLYCFLVNEQRQNDQQGSDR